MSKKTIGEFVKTCIDELKFAAWKKEDFGINEDLYTVQTSECPARDTGKLHITAAIFNLIIQHLGEPYRLSFKAMVGSFDYDDENRLTIVELISNPNRVDFFNKLEKAIPTYISKLLTGWKDCSIDRINHSLTSEKVIYDSDNWLGCKRYTTADKTEGIYEMLKLVVKELGLQDSINFILNGKHIPKKGFKPKEYYRTLDGKKFIQEINGHIYYYSKEEVEKIEKKLVLNKINMAIRFEYDNWEEVLIESLSFPKQISPVLTLPSSSNDQRKNIELTGAASAGNSPNHSPPSTELQNVSIEERKKEIEVS
jgi:hypothetical protein